ncbi:MAG: hypothetical protein HY337_01480, partial [Gemmatimonadetes bacterium]|nr:hypothetical protein [Gemmatimonadota bacterium]
MAAGWRSGAREDGWVVQSSGAVLVVGGVTFGFAGGEYGTLDWWQLKRDLERERRAVERLDAEIDSLQRE